MAIRPLAYGLCVTAIVGISATFSFEYSYQRTLPRQPDPATGHVIQRSNHGAILYYSSDELELLRGFFVGGLLCGVLGGLIWRKYNL